MSTTSPTLTVRQQIHSAHDTAELLSEQILEAHSRACGLQADLLVLLLRDLIASARSIESRLNELTDACPTTWPIPEQEP